MEPIHVLLLHGLPADAADWVGVCARLRGRGLTPLAPDRPGWGRSPLPGRDVAGNAEVALASLDKAGVARAVIAGHSWGSLVALALAEQTPERVAALGLVSPFGPGSLDLVERTFASRGLGKLLVSLQLTLSGLALLAPPTRQFVASRFGYDEAALSERGRRWLGSRARRTFLLEQRALVDDLEGLLAGARSLSLPTRVLVGARDRATGADHARSLAETIPGARLRVVPRVGHFLPQLRPELVAEELADLAAAVS